MKKITVLFFFSFVFLLSACSEEVKEKEVVEVNEAIIAQTGLDAVEVSYDIFNRFFLEKDHFDVAMSKTGHNGYGFEGCENTPASDGPGFFRSGTDLVFLAELYHQLERDNDPRMVTVHTYTLDALRLFTTQLNDAKPCSLSWANGISRTPDEGWILMALSKSYDYVPMDDPLKRIVKEQVEQVVASVAFAYEKLDASFGPGMDKVPKIMACEQGEEQATAISNNLIGLYAGSLAQYGLSVWMNEQNEVDLADFPHLSTLKNTVNYTIHSQGEEVGFWKVGGNRVESCDVAIHYNTWNVMGLSWALEGIAVIPNEQNLMNETQNAIEQSVSALKKLHEINGYFPERVGFDYAVRVNTKTPAFVLPVSYAGDQEILDLVIRDVGSYIQAAGDESGGDRGESNFHRLLSGLSGAMHNELSILK